MVSECPKCGKPVSDCAVYCEHCGYGLTPYARTAILQTAGTMIIVATIASLIIFILSANALVGVYRWYPQFVAQQWFIYDQLFTVFSFLGLVFGAFATALISARRNPNGAVGSAMACTLSGAGVFTVSLIQPLAVLWQSVLYYLPLLFIIPMIGTSLTYLRKEELEQSR